jgi:hypothetical protein
MSYMNQEKKAELAPGIKAVLKKYGVKGTIGVRDHSTLVVNLKGGKLNILENWYQTATKYSEVNNYGDKIERREYLDVNHFWIDEGYSGQVKEFLNELLVAMKGKDWYNNSDIMTDYFDTAYYIDINVGKWDKPYVYEV